VVGHVVVVQERRRVDYVALGELDDLALRQQQLGERQRRRVALEPVRRAMRWHISNATTMTPPARALVAVHQAPQAVERAELLQRGVAGPGCCG
jgi:hypothetical protein